MLIRISTLRLGSRSGQMVKCLDCTIAANEVIASTSTAITKVPDCNKMAELFSLACNLCFFSFSLFHFH